MDNSIIGVIHHDMADRHYKVWAEIDLGALRRNYRRTEELVRAKGSDARVMPIIKADAYGHGAVQCLLALVDEGARFFGVSSVSEGIELRHALKEANITEHIDIIVLGYSVEDDVDLIHKYDFIQTVFSLEYAKKLSLACESRLSRGSRIRAHIKADTGMNRLGFRYDDAESIVKAAELVGLEIEGIFTHYACADETQSAMTDIQSRRFEDLVRELEAKGVNFAVKHICNSAGILRKECKPYDAVRAGIILYGVPPSYEFDKSEFEPVMTLKTRVAHIHEINAGETVSYGATFTADRKMKIATIPVGYADGFIRAYAGASVRVGRTACRVVGRICMDQCMIDVTGADVEQGDEVVLLGCADDLEEYARLADTIPYEVLCLVGKRVPRVYIDR